MGEELIDAPRVQRLRRVHQLGTGSVVYPGANHTRFEHSLGAYHLAGQAARALGLSEGERKAVQAAALLHDVGHGPFSHASDPLYRDFLQRTHEDLSVDAIQNRALGDVLTRHGVEPASVVALVRGEGALAGLVSDLALTPRGLAVKAGSVPAAEMLLVTRVQMYATVYFHRTLRVAERMIERAFRLALDAGEIRPEQLPTMDDVAATMTLRHSKTDAWRLMLAVDQRKLYKVAL